MLCIKLKRLHVTQLQVNATDHQQRQGTNN